MKYLFLVKTYHDSDKYFENKKNLNLAEQIVKNGYEVIKKNILQKKDLKILKKFYK